MNWLNGSWLDLKLGGRMLLKYPGLTIVGGLAMAFAICVGTVIFEVLTPFIYPTLPLPAGERLVQIRDWDVGTNRPEPRALHAFVVWRGVLEGRNPVGQQLRFAQEGGDPSAAVNPWIEIVGVVKELGVGTPTRKGRAAGLYLPATPDRFDRVYMMVHVRGDPMTLGPELREIAAAVDPTLRVSELQRVDQVTEGILWVVRLWLRVTIMMTAVALLLSLSGIYAVLSFIVARRAREIGVRVALGASRGRVVVAIFRRPLFQVGLGVVAGGALIAVAGNIETDLPGLSGELSIKQYAMVLAYAVLMLGVCLLACAVPTRRALGVEPTVALRTD